MLTTTEDLLATYHEIICIGDLWVLWVRHGIKGSRGLGEFVEHVEVGIEFLAD